MTITKLEPGGIYRYVDARNGVLHVLLPALGDGVTDGASHWDCGSDGVSIPVTGEVVADATLMVPADRAVDVPPGQPRVVVRDLPEKLDLTKIDHRQVFDRALSDAVTADPVPAVVEAVAVVRGAVSTAARRAREAQRMAAFREEAKQMLEGTAEQRIERIAELLRDAEDCAANDEDYRS